MLSITVEPLCGGCNNNKTTKTIIKSRHYKFTCYSPIDKHQTNSCGLKCLIKAYNLSQSPYQLRQLIGGKQGKLTIADIYEIYNKLDLQGQKQLIISLPLEGEMVDLNNYVYLILMKEHYYLIEKADLITVAVNSLKTKRGYLYFDLETRPDERKFDMITVNGNQTKSYHLRPTVFKAWYRPYKAKDFKELSFKTNDKEDACRQFINWIIDEKNAGRTYTCLAHNGGKFDFYFIINQLTKEELLSCDMKLRGFGIINLNIYGCNFKDSYCYLTSSLHKLCNDFKITNAKQTEINYHEQIMTNEQLCFYKHELTFNEFMNLENTEPEYWKL